MYDILDELQTEVSGISDIPRFGYKAAALTSDDGIPGHNEYADSNDNNIPLIDGTELSLQEQEKGFRANLDTLSRAFFTHFFGRSSFNINKMKALLSSVLGTYKSDYTHNFRKWDSTATYASGDVCFLVANGIRYCFKSKVNNNTASISASADGTLSFDDTKWALLTEQRTVVHPIGKPFLWFGGDLPENGSYICFSDGQQYSWSSYPELNNPEFRSLLSRFTFKGAGADDTHFTVPTITELYPMSVAELPDALSVIAAKVPPHLHSLSGSTATNATYNTNHTHPMNSSNDAGSHVHYTGDYYAGARHNYSSSYYHEDSRFDGAEVDIGNHWEIDCRIYLTPTLEAASFSDHSVTAPSKALAHTHSGAVTPSGYGDFGLSSGKYRPGTIKTMLVVRAS